MALTHQSIATINSPEFINLQPLDINPLMSSCEIKVFYLGMSKKVYFMNEWKKCAHYLKKKNSKNQKI